MAHIIRMPKLSDTMEEGGIAQWLKKEGDRVKDGEPLVEIETDKATLEFASPESGYLMKLLAQPGSGIALDAPICVLGNEGEIFDPSILNAEHKKSSNGKSEIAHEAVKGSAKGAGASKDLKAPSESSPQELSPSQSVESKLPAGVHIVRMPKLSDTMEEGGIAQWLKKEGDRIKDGEPLVEIETDKATLEFAAPESGVLIKILAPKGGGVALEAPICVIGKEGMVFDPKWNLEPHASSAKAPTGDSSSKTGGSAVAKTQISGQSATRAMGEKASLGRVSDLVESIQTANQGAKSHKIASMTRIKASPLARKLAQGRGIDLRGFNGSGPNGRVIVRDLDQIVNAPNRSNLPRVANLNSGQDRQLPLSMMRKTIAKRLLQGKNEAPHFYLSQSARMDQILDWREKLNEEREKLKLPRISVNDFFTLAVSRALRLHPTVNSSWQGDSILEHGSVHIAMAVALPTGLVTPVIRNTDQLSISEISEQAKYFGLRAREGKLTNEDFANGTFTISNLGMTGIEEFTAIINPPQAAILAVGKTLAQPWVNDKGGIEVQNRVKLSLSCDHRVIDGMVGAQFMETLVKFLETPILMFS